jgi:hypothetical protein
MRVLAEAIVLAGFFAAMTWAPPAEAQRNCLCGRPPNENPLFGLLPDDFTAVDATAAFESATLNGATLALIPSANFNEYSRRWVHWFEDDAIERNWAYRLMGMSREDTAEYEHNTDPRRFADQLAEAVRPHVRDIVVSADFHQARAQGATFFLVVDAWMGTPNWMNEKEKTWAGAYLFDGSLQRLFLAQDDHEVRRRVGLVREDDGPSQQAYDGATEPVIAALRARLGAPPTAAAN